MYLFLNLFPSSLPSFPARRVLEERDHGEQEGMI